MHAGEYESTNITLDDDYPLGGNYWSDYNGTDFYGGPYQNISGSDDIGDTPYIIDEDNQDNYPLMGPWTIEGENVTVTPSSVVNIIFENVTSEGVTTLNTTQVGPDPPSGFKLTAEPPIYYDIETTANCTGTIKITITYNGTGLTEDQENNLQILQWNETLHQWTDITTQVDTENNVIHGETTHLSIFAIMSPPNIVVTNIETSKTVVGQGYPITINVFIENQGYFAETINVTAYCNTTPINTIEVTLTSTNSTTVVFTWDTTGVAKGNYTISANATILSGETDTTDNTKTAEDIVMVTIPGDVNGNGHVFLYDAVKIGARYGAKKGDPNYDANCDINDNGQIFLYDAVIVGAHYGQTYP